MKSLVGIHAIATSLLLTAIPCASEVTPPWTFQVMADWHGAEWYATHPVPGDDEVLYNLQKDGLLNIREEFGGDLIVMPGDTNSGNWNIQSWVDNNFPGHSIQDAVYKAGINCYSTVRNLFTEAGYEKILISIGDHELGDNYWGPHGKDTKTDSLTHFRSSFTTALYMDEDSGEHIYKEGIGNADSTPIGTPYEYTSFAHRHKNALFITMDVFHEISDRDFLDRVNGIGGEGIITGDVTGSHLDWFEEVLKEARNDDGIKHIIVQSHLPILQPVRKIYSSAMFFDRAERSSFWKKMVEYGVDIYLAGEVHAHTASKTDESDLVQIVSKSLGFFNFLQVTVTDDSIRVDAINEVGPEINWRKKSEYEVFGSLIIDKSSQDETKITSDGELKLLDIGKPLLRFDFEETHSLNERQILGMFTSKSLLPEKIAMHGRDLYDCIHNHGIFGQQYDAPVADVEIVEGGIKGNAGKFNGGSSQLGVYAFGPAVGGYIISYSIWFKTTKSGELILVHSGQAWSKTQTRENIFTLTLNNGIPTVYANKSSTLKAIDVAPLNDGGWHQVAVSMRRLSSPLSEVKLYIDGKETSTLVHLDMELFFVNYSRISIGSLGFTSTTEADFPNWSSFHGLIDEVYLWARPIWPFDLRKSPRNTFEGEVDDVMVWSKPLQEQDILELWDPSTIDPKSRDDYKTISCGRGDGSWRCAEGDRDVVPIDEIHSVRCCRDCDDCSSPWKQKCPIYNLSLFALSKIQGVCKQGTFQEANDFCKSVTKGRLCTLLEVQNGCAKGTGCQFDREMVWTCAYHGLECITDTECCGLCVNGKCEGGSRSVPQQAQGVQSLTNGLGSP